MEIQDFIILISAGATALAAAIGVLYKTVMNLSKKQSDMSEEIGMLKGEHKGIRELSYDVLDAVHRAIDNRDKKEKR
tara:strand:- start:846 stop:1076 length:231 start_codon:yes stop_codon:yes gene_type:complete